MSELIIILLIVCGFVYAYAKGVLGGVPKILKRIMDDDLADFECVPEMKIKKLQTHREGNDFIIDLLFEHVYTTKTLQEVQAILLNKCPFDPSNTTASGTTASGTTPSNTTFSSSR
jgi:hypothetical protein